jgi:hypothetical protein
MFQGKLFSTILFIGKLFGIEAGEESITGEVTTNQSQYTVANGIVERRSRTLKNLKDLGLWFKRPEEKKKDIPAITGWVDISQPKSTQKGQAFVRINISGNVRTAQSHQHILARIKYLLEIDGFSNTRQKSQNTDFSATQYLDIESTYGGRSRRQTINGQGFVDNYPQNLQNDDEAALAVLLELYLRSDTRRPRDEEEELELILRELA